MLYCSNCARTRKWPESFFKQTAVCQGCQESRPCNNVADEDLPQETTPAVRTPRKPVRKASRKPARKPARKPVAKVKKKVVKR